MSFTLKLTFYVITYVYFERSKEMYNVTTLNINQQGRLFISISQIIEISPLR